MSDKLKELLEIKKADYMKSLNARRPSELISDAHLLILDKSHYINELGSEIAFWEHVIEWSKSEYQYTQNFPLNRGAEKQLLIDNLTSADMNSMSKEEHTHLVNALVKVLNGNSALLSINRIKGGQATRKITDKIKKDILVRLRALEKLYPNRRMNAHVDELAEEFGLSKTSIKSILPKKTNARRLT